LPVRGATAVASDVSVI